MIPPRFEDEFPFEAGTLAYVYEMQSKRFFDLPWLHLFASGGWNSIPYGKRR